MKPFNLEEAKAGKSVITRSGQDVRILATDVNSDTGYCIVVALTEKDGRESIQQFNARGRYFNNGPDNHRDLFMKTTIKTYYVNLYWASNAQTGITSGSLSTSEAAAIDASNARQRYIKTIEVTREE